MTAPVRVCRACDEPIEEPGDVVYVHHEPSNSGPGWPVWAHRAHADLVGPDPEMGRILVGVLMTRAACGPS